MNALSPTLRQLQLLHLTRPVLSLFQPIAVLACLNLAPFPEGRESVGLALELVFDVLLE